jgi:chaperone required for assembly of F1-ATPase
MKRFWETASVVREGVAFAVRLDGKPMRLPERAPLALPGIELAEAIAAEWQAAGGDKGGDFTPDDLPLTRLAATAQERIAPDPGPTIEALAQYGQSDLLCYRADRPEELVARQALLWQPWLDRAARLYGAHLRVVLGVMPQAQPVEALAALREALAGRSACELAGLGVLVPVTGSLVLGLAVADGALNAGRATDLAFLDQDFQAEKWGLDAEAVARRRAVEAEIGQAARFIELGKSGGTVTVPPHPPSFL